MKVTDALFDANSAWREANLPFATTLTFGYANGSMGYILSMQAYEYTCYECDTTKIGMVQGNWCSRAFLIC